MITPWALADARDIEVDRRPWDWLAWSIWLVSLIGPTHQKNQINETDGRRALGGGAVFAFRLSAGTPLAFADVTGGAKYPPRLSGEGKLELTEESRLAQP